MAISSEIVGQPSGDNDPTASSFSFASLREGALKVLDGGTPAADEAVVEQADPVEAVAEPAAETTDLATATDKQIAALSDDSLVEVTIDGEKQTVTLGEARNGYQRQAKFTKEMTALRTEQQAFEATRATQATMLQERDAMVNILRDPALLRQLIEQAHPDLLAAATGAVETPDVDDIATVGQVQAYMQSAQQKLEAMQEGITAQLQTQAREITQRIEDNHATAKLSAEINTTINSLFKEHPYIGKVIPNATDMLRWQVSQLNPKTAEEAVESFKTVFGGWVEDYKLAVAETNKTAVLTKQKLVKNNIQPPGGSAPQQQPASFKKSDGTIDWAALRSQAASIITDK
jgi:hypothetical protein